MGTIEARRTLETGCASLPGNAGVIERRQSLEIALMQLNGSDRWSELESAAKTSANRCCCCCHRHLLRITKSPTSVTRQDGIGAFNACMGGILTYVSYAQLIERCHVMKIPKYSIYYPPPRFSLPLDSLQGRIYLPQ